GAPSERESHAELNGPRITNRRHRVERRHWIRRIRSGSTRRIPCELGHPIGQIERFDQPIDARPAGEPERTTDSETHGEEVIALARIPRDELDLLTVKVRRRYRPIRVWPSCRSLQAVDAGHDVERKGRV